MIAFKDSAVREIDAIWMILLMGGIYFEATRIWFYTDEFKALQYFSHMMRKTATTDAFTKVMKMTNHTGL